MKQQITIVLDAANICCAYLEARTKQHGLTESQKKNVPPLIALKYTLDFFTSFNSVAPFLRFVAICPNWWRHCSKSVEDEKLMNNLVRNDILFFADAKEHDDHYILSYSTHKNGFFISNDQYRDHYKSEDDAQWVTQKRIGFMFIGDDFVPAPSCISRLEDELEKVCNEATVSTSSASIEKCDMDMDIDENIIEEKTYCAEIPPTNQQHYHPSSNIAKPDRLLF